jgi:iron complex outermembrane recepter protein
MKQRVIGNCVIGAAMGLSLASTVAWADEQATPAASTNEAEGIQEIVVTANRREESVMTVPIAVTAISQNELESRGITNVSEMSNLVPTLQVDSAFGDTQPNFTLRGIGMANEHNPNQASPIGIYFDDAYIAARADQGMQLFDLERVEVLEGPQGTLYGRNTTGGAINFISKMPSLNGDTDGYVEAGYATYNTFSARGAFETTLSDGVAGVRLSFSSAHGDGFNKDIYPSEPAANSTDNDAVRLILKVKPVDQLDIMLKLTAGNADPTQAGVYNLGTGPDGLNTVLNTSRQAQGLTFWEIDSARLGYNAVANWGSELVTKYRINDALTLTWLQSYDTANAQFTQEGTGENSPVFTQPLDTLYGNVFKMFNEEMRLSYAGDLTKAQGGVYYGYDEDKSNSYYWLLDGAADIHQAYDQVRNSRAIFGQVDQTLVPKLVATLGVRYTWDDEEYKNYYSYVEPAAVSFTGQRNTEPQYWLPSKGAFVLGSYDAATGQIVSGSPYTLNSNAATGRAALAYTLPNDELVYASFSKGYRDGAFCGQCFLNNPINTTAPEKDDAYELGTKGLFFDRKFSLASDVFWINYKNQQTDEQIGLQTILHNVPKSRMRGIEVEATVQPVADFRLGVTAAYIDAIYDKLVLAVTTVEGAQQPYTPRNSGSVYFDWQFANYKQGKFTFTPNYSYQSHVYFSPYNGLAGNAPLSNPENQKLNARVNYETDKYSVELWCKNLTDRQTFADGLDLRSFGYYYLVQAPPRTYGITFGAKF